MVSRATRGAPRTSGHLAYLLGVPASWPIRLFLFYNADRRTSDGE